MDCFEESLVIEEGAFFNARPARESCLWALWDECEQPSGHVVRPESLVCSTYLPHWLAGGYTAIIDFYVTTLGHEWQVIAGLAQLAWAAGFMTGSPDICQNTFDANVVWAWYYSRALTPTFGRLHRIFHSAHIDGPTMCKMTTDDLHAAGAPIGVAHQFLTNLTTYLYGELEPPPGHVVFMSSTSNTYEPAHPHRPFNVSVTLILEQLYEIDEVSFTFNIGFLLIFSWEDDRISTVCNGVGRSDSVETPSNDYCAHYWQPTFEFSNVLQFEEGNYEVISDLGFHTEVGANSLRAHPDSQNMYLEHSIGYRAQRIKASFVSPMGFHYFPFDCQNLVVRIRPVQDTTAIYRFVPSSEISPTLRYYNWELESQKATLIAGWNVTSIHHRERTASLQAAFGSLVSRYASSSALFNAIERIATRQEAPLSSAWEPHAGAFVRRGTPLEVPGLEPRSEAQFSIQVQRQPHSFIYNFALLVALLIFIAFSSFAFPDGDMSDRIGLTLTVFLGVIFFQILVVESLPKSRNFTTMHLFMFLSSIFNGVICVQHVLVYLLHWLVGDRARIVRSVRKLKRDIRALRAVVRLQRAWRKHRVAILERQPVAQLASGAASRTHTTGRGLRQRRSFPGWRSTSSTCGAASAASTEPTSSTQDVTDAADSVPRAGPLEVSSSVVESAADSSTNTLQVQVELGSPRGSRSSRAVFGLTKSQVEIRMQMAAVIEKGAHTPLATRLKRRLVDWGVVALDNINMFFVVFTSTFYFFFVLWYLFLAANGRDEKCEHPWATIDDSLAFEMSSNRRA